MANAKETKTFDQDMAELETIVTRLESGELPLEEALAAFETGIGLVRTLNQRLSEAEARVELLTKDSQGAPRLQPLNPEDERND
jgi:exodeoxyribonuclease VII small subunit